MPSQGLTTQYIYVRRPLLDRAQPEQQHHGRARKQRPPAISVVLAAALSLSAAWPAAASRPVLMEIPRAGTVQALMAYGSAASGANAFAVTADDASLVHRQAIEAQRAAAGAPSVPAAAAALQRGRTQLIDGNYPRAGQEFGAIQATYPGSAEAIEAALRLGEAALADDHLEIAETYLRRFLTTYPADPQRPLALLLLGRALEGRGAATEAAAAWQEYASSAAPEDSVADVVLLRSADLLFRNSMVGEGWAAVGQSVAAAGRSGSASARARTLASLGQRYADGGNRAQAVEIWQQALRALGEARKPARLQAELAWKLVSAYQALGRRDLANELRRRVTNEWPRTFTAWQAMNDLGVDTVAPFQRGVIAFTNRRWAVASDAMQQYLISGAPQGKADEARYYRAVALLRQSKDGAVEALDQVADLHPQSPWAADALWEAGSYLLRSDHTPEALARFERLAIGFPASEHRGQALYWLGKLLPQQGNAAAGQRYMEAAASSGYEDFYTFRARQALRRPSPAAKPLEAQGPISTQDRAAWQQWLAAHGASPEAQAQRREQIEADSRFRRGTILLEAGFRKEADEEFRELLDTTENDPAAVEHVAVFVRDLGFYPLSVTLGHRLLDSINRMGETSLLAAPRVVQKLVLPLAFIGLVESAARAKGLDPLLMLGLMKQESWFEPRAESSASARGLTQFIEPTAQSVAKELSWPNWTWDHMNLPYVSVPFGAHYLSSLTRQFRGNYHFAVAGYNGGPGNVLRWAGGDWNRDIDLFIEGITYVETRGYVRAVAGNYELYKAIYNQ